MGLLRRLLGLIQGSTKSTNSLPKNIHNRLERALDSYIQAYSSKQMRFLSPYFDRRCIQELAPSIYNEDRFFATSRFRRATWELVRKQGTVWVVKHKMEFDKIKAAGFSINVSQAYEELWSINTTNNLVERVER